MKNYGDITKISGEKIEPVDVIIGGSPCFPAGTLVLTNKGYIEIENVTVGMYVLTHNGRWRKVTATGSTRGETIILRGNHYGLECTPNHPIYSVFKMKKDWIPAADMRGRLWAVPSLVDPLPIDLPGYSNDREKEMGTFSKKLFYNIGLWLGDSVYSKVQNSAFFVYGTAFRKWLTDNFGEYGGEKRLPAWIYGIDGKLQAALINGLTDTADNPPKGKMIRISTTSKKLAEGVRILGEIQGYSPMINCKQKDGDDADNQRPYYDIQFRKRKSKTGFYDAIHDWHKVRSVQKTGVVKEVYNLTVEEDNSYVADGIVVHNCQNLSIAGNRKGLSGSESQLFLEQVRLTKEFRKLHGKPRYLVWENVKGAFSCNKGEDFRLVLESLSQIPDPSRQIPMPKKWTNAGVIFGESYSIAWRLMDAQYWGVPQRRQRIALVADFDGLTAPDILFDGTGEIRSNKLPLVLMDDEWDLNSKWYQEHKTCNFSERPSTPIESHLHEILELNPDPKYNLSQKACLGILRRAEHRNKILPDVLKETLEYQAGLTANPPCFCDNKCYIVCAANSRGMESDNPYVGFYETDTTRTLDQNAGSPCCNQGGLIVLQGSMIGRNDKNGPAGNGINKDVSFTLNTIDRHAVCAFHLTQDPIVMEDKTPCVSAGSGSGQAVVGVLCLNDQGGKCMSVTADKTATLRAQEHGHQPVILCLNPWDSQTNRVYNEEGSWPTLCARSRKSGMDRAAVLTLHPDIAGTICASGAGTNRPAGQGNETDLCICVMDPSKVVAEPLCVASGQANAEILKNLGSTLTCHHEQPFVLCQKIINMLSSSKSDMEKELTNKTGDNQCPFQNFFILRPQAVVRRLTPLECERLQGYPDNWTNIGVWTDNKGKLHKESSDSARYKALGNSIALPQWRWVLGRISGQYEGTPTMGSLFDGIGGFSLIWSEINGIESVLWTSEIEPFPIAVTERRFAATRMVCGAN